MADNGLTEQFKEAIQEKKGEWDKAFGLPYIRLTDDFHGYPRGTAIFETTLIAGYPQIGRILSLETGLNEQFSSSYWLEEKINGYNVRIAKVGEQVIALSRGGFICHFTTDRLRDLLDVSVFEADPDLVICAEVAGPENPYHEGYPPFVEQDVELFTFDLMGQREKGFLTQQEKMERIGRHNLPSTTIFGHYDGSRLCEIHELARQLDREGREGIVFKEVGKEQKRAKYVVGSAHLDDINDAAINLMDLPCEFFTDRILRLALFLEEHGLDATHEVKDRLGEAFMDRLKEAITQYRETHHVSRRFRCRFRERENATEFLNRLGRLRKQGMQILKNRLEQEGDFWVLEFERISTRMVGLLGHSLHGGISFD